MRFAKWAFLGAGVYGLIALVPMYVLEGEIGRRLGPVTHPEYFYGFVGLGVVFQLVFLAIGRDPARYRALMPLAVLEKLSFGVPVWLLYAQARVPGTVVILGTIDLLLGALFAVAWLKTRPAS